jgi:hypothetical protein
VLRLGHPLLLIIVDPEVERRQGVPPRAIHGQPVARRNPARLLRHRRRISVVH